MKPIKLSSDRSPSENLTTSGFKALGHLSKHKSIVIQNADKGKTIVILDKIFYISAKKNSYLDKCIKEFLDRVLTPEIVVGTVLKKDLMIVLLYLGKLSHQIRTRINRVMKNKLPLQVDQFFYIQR